LRPSTSFTIDDRREALAFARAFHTGDGDGAAALFELIDDPVRLLCALADAYGALVRDIAYYCGMPEVSIWDQLIKDLDNPPEEYLRLRNIRFN
jgi:hypothetical protein